MQRRSTIIRQNMTQVIVNQLYQSKVAENLKNTHNLLPQLRKELKFQNHVLKILIIQDLANHMVIRQQKMKLIQIKNIFMTMLSLRGGGNICSNTHAIINNQEIAIYKKIDPQMIQQFIQDLSQRCQNILTASQRIGLSQSKDEIIQEIKWFQLSSQFLNQIVQDKQMVQENIQLILSNLEILLEAILNIIQSQFFLSYHLLKICNLFSLLIFIYYINSPEPPMKQEMQLNYQNILDEIGKYIEYGQSNFYQNSIIYEFEVIKMCINTCPTNSTQGQEILIGTFKEVFASLLEMSPSAELMSGLLDGAIYIYQKVQQKKQKKIFQVIFYLEQLKWRIIEQVQNGKGINVIRKSLNDNYNKLIKASNQWIVKCSWIKLISDLLQYVPIISQSGYQELVTQYNLNKDWKSLIQSKQITIIDKDQNIGIISSINNGDQVGRIFRTQFVLLDQLRSLCLNGNQDIPKFDCFVNNTTEILEDDKQQNLLKILEYVDNLEISKVAAMYRQLLENLYEFIETWNSLEQQDNADIIQQQTKVELQIALIQKLDIQLQRLTINSKIINKQLESFFQDQEKNDVQYIDQFHYYQLIRNYFNIIQTIGIIDESNMDDQQKNFIDLFPDIEFKKSIKQIQEQNKFIDIIRQVTNRDLIQIVQILDEQSKVIQQSKMEPTTKLKQFQILLSQFVDYVLEQLRQDLFKQEQELYFLESSITKRNQTISDRTNTQNTQQYLVYYSIISHMKFIYQEVNDIINDMTFDKQQVQEFKLLPITDILGIYNNQLDSEQKGFQTQIDVKRLLNYNNLPNQQKLNQIQIFLWTLKQLLQNTQERTLKLNNFVQIFKSKCQSLIEKTGTQDSQYQKMVLENAKILIQYIEQGNSRQNLITILDQRKKLFSDILEVQKDNKNLKQQIQKEITFTSIITDEQFYDLIENSKVEFKENINNSSQKIIGYLNEDVNQEKQKEDYTKMLKLIEKLDQITREINQQFKIDDKQKQFLQNSNKLIISLQNLTFKDQQLTEDIVQGVQKELDNIIQSYQEVTKIDTKRICELIQENKQLINELPQIVLQQQNEFLILPDQGKQENQQIQQSQSLKQKLLGLFDGDSWRYKEYFYFSCLYTYSIVSNQEVKQQLGRIILLGKFKETDYRIRATLKNKEYQSQVEQLVNNEWDNTKDDVQDSLQKTLNQLQSIQLQLQGEERKLQRENLVQQHKDLEQQLEQQIKNVNEIGDILGITINFMKDIKKELIQIQSKLDNMIDSINQIGQDIKFLRGKTPQQLLEIRMQQVLQNKYIQDSSSVYVQIQVKEFKFDTMKEQENTPLFNYDQYDNGEIDEYLKDSNQTSLLIHGLAGSGKSITARKIEEYLWIQYNKQSNNQLWSQQMNLVIPIFIQLPILKEPQFNSIEETLQSQIYNFDQKQVNQFLDFVQNSQIKLIFILDSYDELANQYIGKNLIQSNKIYQWKHKNDLKNPKVITTTRTEGFTNTSYREWFWESNKAGFKNFKEIRLQPFNSNQREEFLNQFGQLQLKLQIKDLLESISKKQSQDIIIQDTLQIYDQLQIGNSFQKQYLLNQMQIKRLIQIIKSHPNVININSDQEISFNKQLQIIWSVDQYQQSIKQMEINDILDTPFMLNIMSDILSSQNYIKDYFKTSFVIEKRNQIQSIINRYKSKNAFITQIYTQEEINELQEFINDKNNNLLIKEGTNIWNRLIESNFFKDFTIMLQYENVIKLLDQLNLKEIITVKERDIDNKAMIYKALTSKKYTIYEFYSFFFNNYTDRQRMKLIYNNDIKDLNQFQIDIQNYAVQFAVTMTINNKTTIEMKPKGILFRGQQETSPFERFFEDLDQHAIYRNLIRKCLPLKQKANFYSFNHKTIQEYLFAKDIIDFLISIDQRIDQLVQLRNKQGVELQNSISNIIVKQYEDCSLNKVNLGTPTLFGAFKFIKMAMKQNEELQEVCYKLSLLSSVFHQLLILSSNSFYIFINVKSVIKNKDFSRIRIGDISINYATFKKCNFSDSIFQRVEIYGINLSNVDLSRIDWQDIYTNDLQTYKSNQKIQSISFSYDFKQIIGGDDQGMLHIWDKQSSQLIKEFQIDYKILYINQFQDKKLISLSQIETETDQVNQFGGHIYNTHSIIKVWDGEYNLLNSEELSINELQDDPCSLFTHNNIFIGIIVKQKTIKLTTISDFKLHQQRGFDHDLVKIQIFDDQNIIYAITYKDWIIIKWDFNNDTEQQIQTNIKQPNINAKNINLKSFFSFDCNLLIVKFDTEKKNLKVFSLMDKQLQDLRFQHNIDKFFLSKDNKYLVLCDRLELYAYDIYSQSRLFFLKVDQFNVQDLKFNSNSTEIITAQWNGKLWDLELILKEKQNQHEVFHEIQQAQTSPDNLLIYYQYDQYSKEYESGLFVANTKTGEQLERINISFTKFMVCLSGRYIYFIDNKQNLIKYDINSKKFDNLKQISLGDQSRILNISQSHDHRLLKIAYNIDNETDNISIILLNEDATKIQCFKMINTIDIQFTHDRMSLYYIGKDRKNIQKFQIMYQETEKSFLQELDEPNLLHEHWLEQFFITQDDEFIITRDRTQMLYKWNISKLEKVQILDDGNYFRIFNQYLMVWQINSDYLCLYDLNSQKLMAKQPIYDAVQFYENNKMMISVEYLKYVKIWKFNKKIELQKDQAFSLSLIMPKNRNDENVLHNIKWDNSKIQSNLNFDLITLWTQKTQNIE